DRSCHLRLDRLGGRSGGARACRVDCLETLHQRRSAAGEGYLATTAAYARHAQGGSRMGATPADTEREITHLRGDMTAALEEVERRLRSGMRSVATAEARIAGGRATEDVVERARSNPTLLGVAGVVAAGAVAYGVFAVGNGRR